MIRIEDRETLEDHRKPAAKASDDPEYAAFKDAKVKRGLAQSRDRKGLLPAHKGWERLGLER